MMLVILFNVILVLSCGYALVRGGAPERVIAITFLVVAASTFSVPYTHATSYAAVELPVLAIDAALLIVSLGVAMYANRFWPIWSAAVQMCIVVIHLTKAYDPTILPVVYFAVSSRLAYVMIAMLVVAVGRHQWRLRTYGEDQDWYWAGERGAT